LDVAHLKLPIVVVEVTSSTEQTHDEQPEERAQKQTNGKRQTRS
jgi:hypothetical protein